MSRGELTLFAVLSSKVDEPIFLYQENGRGGETVMDSSQPDVLIIGAMVSGRRAAEAVIEDLGAGNIG